MENEAKKENETNLEQIISVIKQPDGHICIVKGTGREIVDSTTTLIKSIFANALQIHEIKDRAGLIVKIWSDLAFDPLHEILEDDTIDFEDRLVAARAMTMILSKMHSYSSEEIEEDFDDDEYPDDSSTD